MIVISHFARRSGYLTKSVAGSLSSLVLLLPLNGCADGDRPSQGSSSRSSSAQSSAVIQKRADGLIISLPKLEAAVVGSVPKELKGATYNRDTFANERDKQEFTWKIFASTHSRSLQVTIRRHPTVDDARKQVRYAETDMADFHLRRPLNAINSGRARRVPNVADECVGFDLSNENSVSGVAGDQNYYTQKGRYLECRVANVDISVEWLGLNYSKPWSRTSGSGLNPTSADRESQAVVRSIAAVLA